jgi:hypothetical protein
MVPVIGPVAVRGAVLVLGVVMVQGAEEGPVAASGGRAPGATLAEEETTLGGSAVIVGPGRASGPIADAGVPMRRVRPAGVEWRDVVPAVSSARNKRIALSAGNGPPSGPPGLVVSSPSQPIA